MRIICRTDFDQFLFKNIFFNLNRALLNRLDRSIILIIRTFLGKSHLIFDKITINAKGNFSEISFNK